MTPKRVDPETVDLLHEAQANFALALSGLAWAVGAMGDTPDNYAARVLEQLQSPTRSANISGKQECPDNG